MSHGFEIRSATADDVEDIYEMICELAEFEKLRDQVLSTAESIRTALFCEPPGTEAIVAEADGQCVGFALFFHNFSTFLGRSGLYLEDVYVRPTHRRSGIGKALIIELAKIAKLRDCGRFEWSVLDWNENAITFYEELGARVLQDWRIVRLDADGIQKLASK